MKVLTGLLALAGAVAMVAAWTLHRGDIGLPDVRKQLQNAAALPSAAPAKTQARKCLDAKGAVLYTTEASCPSGSREQAVAGGSLNVLPAVKPAAAQAASDAASTPLLRQLADPEGSAALKQKRMDKVLGQ